MLYILLPIITITIVLFILYLYKKNIFEEKILLWILIIIFLLPVIFYIIDKFNIPTKMGMFQNTNSERWFNFFIEYMSTIIGTIVSSLVVVFTLVIQLKKQNESEQEEKRINNIPILDYEIRNDINVICKYAHDIKDNSKDYKEYPIFFHIKNIGLNHARNIEIQVTIDKVKDKEFNFEGHKNFIKKEEEIWIKLIAHLHFEEKKVSNKKCTITIKYSDLLNNNYQQNISFILHYDENQYYKLQIQDIKVDNEKLIK